MILLFQTESRVDHVNLTDVIYLHFYELSHSMLHETNLTILLREYQ